MWTLGGQRASGPPATASGPASLPTPPSPEVAGGAANGNHGGHMWVSVRGPEAKCTFFAVLGHFEKLFARLSYALLSGLCESAKELIFTVKTQASLHTLILQPSLSLKDLFSNPDSGRDPLDTLRQVT